ncbi:MAG: biotin/lipoyl-binding protein [Eubacteriales bacterium]|nr:biotin/lipoyl-binding protein [Eubacteriales bacterium]
MRQFNVTVNGVAYQVSVEEAGASSAPVAVAVAPATAPVAAPAPVAAAAPVAAPAAAPVAAGEKITAPMPGTILDIKVSQGATVKKGDVLLILEAMKMENEIMAPGDGTVKQIAVAKGASVNSGDVLVVIG